VLVEDGVDHVIVEAWAGSSFPDASDLRALVVMGGTMNVDDGDHYPFLAQSRQLMRDAIHAGVPTLGVCLGSQMMARVLDAEVFRASPRNAIFSGLKVTDQGGVDPVLAPFADGLPVLQFHEDTFDVPAGAVALATSESSGLAQAFRYGFRAYAIQFHFEVDEGILRGWIEDIGPKAMAEGWGTTEAELSAESAEHLAAQMTAGKELFRRFLSLAE
jgi:GMP synthase-like glutamine amidotransferase